ncbi:MAG: patatin-like phospholipase family protein [Alkaliphilus sp.]|nr:patatin-like phospholipase family protein [Alkaliphilus sp.]
MIKATESALQRFFKNTKVLSKESKGITKGNKYRVGLALGGGAVWGISHIGVLKALKDNDIPIDCICGTSIGSIVGGLYATGLSINELLNLATHTQWKEFSQLSLPINGLLSNEPMDQFINNIIGEKNIEDLKIPFIAVATDIISGEEILLDKGKLSTAMRASSAIPGIFQPVNFKGRTLVDGGVINNVPASVVKKMGADIIIAVSTTPSLDHWAPKNSLQIILKAFLIMQNKVILGETVLADVFITVDTKGYSPIDLSSSRELYNRGLIAGLSNLEEIQTAISKKR